MLSLWLQGGRNWTPLISQLYYLYNTRKGSMWKRDDGSQCFRTTNWKMLQGGHHKWCTLRENTHAQANSLKQVIKLSILATLAQTPYIKVSYVCNSIHYLLFESTFLFPIILCFMWKVRLPQFVTPLCHRSLILWMF